MIETDTAIARVAKARTLHPTNEAIDPDRLYGVNDLVARGYGARGTIYRAMTADQALRGSLPFLPSIKLGNARRIRGARLLDWLAKLEREHGV